MSARPNKYPGSRTIESLASRYWLNSMANFVVQKARPGRKIFIIGPNRCCTATLHAFFERQGLKSFHWKKGVLNLALEIENRKNSPDDLREFLSNWTVYSDFIYLDEDRVIENNRLFRTYADLFPEAYFILNDRDVDRWVESRLRHRDGQFLARYLAATGLTEESAVARWRAEFIEHRDAVLSFFQGHPRFLHFYTDKADRKLFLQPGDLAPLIDMLSPDYRLSSTAWTKRHTKRRPNE